MKNFTLMLVAVLSLSAVNAQNAHPPKFTPAQTAQLIPALLQGISSVANTTGQNNAERSTESTDSRLFALTLYDNNGNDFYPVDSEYLTYNIASNGGDLYHTLKYSTGFEWDYNTTTLKYDTDLIHTQTFDGNDNIATNVTQLWDTANSTFFTSTQSIYKYDANNNDTSDINQTWDTTALAWNNTGKYIYTYDANNNETSSTYQFWYSLDTDWVNYTRSSYTFDAHNNETSEIDQYWDGVSVWDSTYKYMYTYNANNEDTAEIEQNWNTTTLEWDNYDKYIYIFDANNNDTTEIVQYWNTTVWANLYKYKYTYVANNPNPLTEIDQSVNQNTLAWVNTNRDLTTYNGFNQVTSLITSTWDDTTQSWVETALDNEAFLYYQDYTTGINKVADNIGEINLYPNPSSDFIHATIQLKQTSDLQLRLVNMLGQTVWSTDAGNVSDYQNNISVANLPDGVYLLEMITGSGTKSREVVVTH